MNDSFLKAGQNIEPLRILAGIDFVFWSQIAFANQTENRSLDPTETEVQGAIADFRYRKGVRVPIPQLRQPIDNRSSGILKSEQTSDFVISLAGGVIPGSSDQAISQMLEVSRL